LRLSPKYLRPASGTEIVKISSVIGPSIIGGVLIRPQNYIEADMHLYKGHLCLYKILCYGLSHIVLLDHGTNGKTQKNRCR